MCSITNIQELATKNGRNACLIEDCKLQERERERKEKRRTRGKTSEGKEKGINEISEMSYFTEIPASTEQNNLFPSVMWCCSSFLLEHVTTQTLDIPFHSPAKPVCSSEVVR